MKIGIGTKIVGGFSVSSLLAVLAVCGGFWVASTLDKGLQRSAQFSTVLRNHMQADMMHDALRSDVLSAYSSGDTFMGIKIQDVQAELADHASEFESAIIAELSAVEDPTLREQLEKLKQPLQEYIDKAREIVAKSGSDVVAAKAMYPAFLEKFKVLEALMATATETINQAAIANDLAVKEKAKQTDFFLLGLLALSLLVGVTLMWFARTAIVYPILEVTGMLLRLSRDEDENTQKSPISQNIDRRKRKRTAETRQDEIGDLARAAAHFKLNKTKLEELGKQQIADKLLAEEATRKAEAAAIEAERNMVSGSIGAGLKKLADKDLTYRLSNLPEAYRKLEEDFNSALDQLEQTIQSVANNTETINTGTQEISAASDDLSRRTESQAADLEQTAAAVAEITSTVRKTANGAKQAREVVAGARDEAKKSSEVVGLAIDAMGGIEKSSQEINKIIGVIDEIAFQTNLLALNAGVEAARAGDAGRGFAVVATEVRSLAKRSAESAQEIKQLLHNSRNQIERGAKLVAETGTSLNRIVERVVEVNTVFVEIADSAQSQAEGLQEVNKAVGHMDLSTQQNAAMSEESNAATHSLAQQSQELADIVAGFTTRGLRSVLPSNQKRHPHKAAQLLSHDRATHSPKRVSAGGAARDDWTEF